MQLSLYTVRPVPVGQRSLLHVSATERTNVTNRLLCTSPLLIRVYVANKKNASTICSIVRNSRLYAQIRPIDMNAGLLHYYTFYNYSRIIKPRHNINWDELHAFKSQSDQNSVYRILPN